MIDQNKHQENNQWNILNKNKWNLKIYIVCGIFSYSNSVKINILLNNNHMWSHVGSHVVSHVVLTLMVAWTGTEWTTGDQSNPGKEHPQLHMNGLQCILMTQLPLFSLGRFLKRFLTDFSLPDLGL